jgi:chitinase
MKRWLGRCVLVVVMIVASMLAGRPSGAAPGAKPKDKVFVGYLFGSVRGIDYRLYTHICHAFQTADADGKLRKERNVPSPTLTTEAHKAGVKVLVSLGGWGWDQQFASIVARPEAEDRYVKGVMQLVENADYDGIDLDWEYPDTKDEIVGFERLVKRFRTLLDALGTNKGRPMFLTMAASANPGTLSWLRKELIVENFDWLNVMTYDFTGDWVSYAGHHSPLFASSKQPSENRGSTELSMRYLVEERKIPADRLAVGIPLYGRGFGVAKPYASTKGAPRTRLPGDYKSIARLLKEQGWTREWDDETKNPWLISPDHKSVIGYDDAESVALKTDWAMKQGFRGIFFWQIDQDRMADGTHPLQEACRKSFDAGRRP